MNSRRQDGSIAPSCRRARLAMPASRGPRQARLIASWRKTLDAFGEALSSDKRYYSAFELNVLERELAADRRWLEHFSAIRSFP